MQRKPLTKEAALTRLEALCSRSEQCESDIVRKLYNWGLSASDRKEIIQSLRENRFVDDARFAKSYANDKARFSSWGPNKIKVELIKRKINASYIKEALSGVDRKVWNEGLLRATQSKARNIDLIGEDEWDNREKLFRYLIMRGFPSSAVSKAIDWIKKQQLLDRE